MAHEIQNPGPQRSPDAGIARPAGASLDAPTDQLPVVAKRSQRIEPAVNSSVEQHGIVDVRPHLLASGVPEPLLSGLNQHGVYSGYLEQVTNLSRAAADPKTESSVLVEEARGLMDYEDYVVSHLRTHFTGQGLEGDALEDRVDEIAEVLLGPSVPADAVADAVSPVISIAREEAPSPLSIIGALRKSGSVVQSYSDDQPTSESDVPSSHTARPSNPEPLPQDLSQVESVVFHERSGDPARVAALYRKPQVRSLLARHDLAKNIAAARDGVYREGDSHALDAAYGYIPSGVIANKGGTGELFAPLQDDSTVGASSERGSIVLSRRGAENTEAAVLFDPAVAAREALEAGQKLSDKTDK